MVVVYLVAFFLLFFCYCRGQGWEGKCVNGTEKGLERWCGERGSKVDLLGYAL